MMDKNFYVKQDIIEKLLSREVFTRQVNDIQYVTRCPFCGDSIKHPLTGHFYLRINPNDNYPIVYHCFKCEESGILTNETLEQLGISDVTLKQSVSQLNKTSDKFDKKHLNNNQFVDNDYDYIIPEKIDYNKLEYINKRLRISLNDSDVQNLRIITLFREFIIENGIKELNCKKSFARYLHDNYVGFLTSKGSHILFRDITETSNIRWYKYKIHTKEENSIFFYAIRTSIDNLTSEKIIINLTEGVMDIISVAYNLDYLGENILNIAVTGKNFISILNYLIKIGFAGSNIIINIFSDSDFRYKGITKDTYSTTIDYYRKNLLKFTYIFGEINVYYNLVEKDVGVPKDKIVLERHRL